MKEIVLNIGSKEVRHAVLRNRKLHNLIIERKKSRLISGNIYKGKVTNILHNIQSAFIDIGEGNNGFIHISDILENTQKFQERFDMDFDWEEEAPPKKENAALDIKTVLKPDQIVLVQVLKEPIGNKGARLTSNLSIPGRYLVLLPNSPHRGVSKKVVDTATRNRLKKLIHAFEIPSDMGIICRTASMYATEEQLIEEVHELIEQWNKIIESFHKAKNTQCLYRDSDVIRKTLITALDKQCDRILVDHYPTYLSLNRQYNKCRSPDSNLKIEFYRDKTPIFQRFGVEKEIDKALQRKIWLPSGGYLFFDHTEAMYTIDVNSGKGQQQDNVKNVEAALAAINMEAAAEIARQLRIRNIGGLIIIDFIDMRLKKNQKRVFEYLKQVMQEDSAKCSVLSMSEFGLVEMTRQRQRESLLHILCTHCPYCEGRGSIKNLESSAIEIERAILQAVQQEEKFAVNIHVHPELLSYIEKHERIFLDKLANKLHAKLQFSASDTLHLNQFELYSGTDGERIEV